VAVLIAQHLITSACLGKVFDDGVPLISGSLAIRDNCMAAGIPITKFRNISSEILMGFAGAHFCFLS
jgi:hypothetical protein